MAFNRSKAGALEVANQTSVTQIDCIFFEASGPVNRSFMKHLTTRCGFSRWFSHH